MKLGLSLFIIYALGKSLAFPFHDFPIGPGTLLALFSQDALVAAVVAFSYKVSKPLGWLFYSTALLHFAISMPLIRLMATPLTAPLLRAGGGTLADSIRHHLDLINVALLAGALAAGVVLPRILQRVRIRITFSRVAVVSAAIVAGHFLAAHAGLEGLHRNSLITLVRSLAEPAEFLEVRRPATFIPARSSLHGVLPRANVVLIALESTGASHLASYGAAHDPMPFLSALARDGIVFENAYAAYPESIQGLVSVLASRQPEFGFREDHFRAEINPSLAQVLGDNGHQTALFHSGRFMYLGMDEVIAGAGFQIAGDAGAIGGNYNSSFGVDDMATVKHLLAWLDRRNSERPFFIQYLPIAGHHPYEAPLDGPFPEHDDKSRYLNALHYSDRALRTLVEGLASRGLLENTLLVIYGDHGEAFGEHPGNFGHTLYLYEENVRVPLVFWSPGQLKPARFRQVTSLIDLAPTICDLLGLAAPPAFEGVSAFLELERPAVFLTDYSMRLYGFRFDHWKFIGEAESGRIRLYNLQSDPGERTNLAAAHPEIARALHDRFFRWSKHRASRNLDSIPESIGQR